MKEIPLTQGKTALVDDEDFEFLNQWKWCYVQNRRTGYAMRTLQGASGKQTSISMHRFLLVAGKKDVIDHINHNGVDNRKSNIRVCTASKNAYNRRKQINNSSGVKGIYYSNRLGKWIARIQINKKQHHIGVYPAKEKAALAYNQAAIIFFGEFACLNN